MSISRRSLLKSSIALPRRAGSRSIVSVPRITMMMTIQSAFLLHDDQCAGGNEVIAIASNGAAGWQDCPNHSAERPAVKAR